MRAGKKRREERNKWGHEMPQVYSDDIVKSLPKYTPHGVRLPPTSPRNFPDSAQFLTAFLCSSDYSSAELVATNWPDLG